MIDEQQNVDEQEQPSRRLVLSTSPEQPSGPSTAIQKAAMSPPDFPPLSSSMPLSSVLAKLRYLWQRDPAHKVLMIAIAALIIAGLIFGSLVTYMLSQMSELFLQNGRIVTLPQNAPTGVTLQGTVDFHPTFPTPAGGQGSTASSQPPSTGPTPSLQNTPTSTLQPTPTQQTGQLSLQISSIPTQVSNNSVAPVQVMANEPDVTVRLYVTYNGFPGFYTSREQLTDGEGNATLSWVVSVFTIGRGQAVARVVVMGQDQNGQQASSQMVTVDIVGG